MWVRYAMSLFNTLQHRPNEVIVHSLFVICTQQISFDIHNLVCWVKNGKIKIASSLSAIKLCFYSNVLNNNE